MAENPADIPDALVQAAQQYDHDHRPPGAPLATDEQVRRLLAGARERLIEAINRTHPLDLLLGRLAVGDPHVSINLTFRTPAAASVVLEHVLGAVNRSQMPYELTSTGCQSFDLDEVED